MAYTQPVLGGTTLPHISGYEETREIRGAMVEMADASVHFDNVSSTPKRTFVLSWSMLTDAQKTTIQTTFDTLAVNSAVLVLPTGETPSPSVTRSKSGLKFIPVKGAEGMLWSTSLELREV